MISLILGVFLHFISFNDAVNQFEGRISMVKNTCYDTTYVNIYIKDTKVRIEEYDKTNSVDMILLYDFKEESLFILNPSKKLYTEEYIPVTKEMMQPDSNFVVLKTENSKIINGQLCYQWRVKNRYQNSEVAFWVVNNDIYIFNEVLNYLRRTNNIFNYFSIIPGTEGFFPILSVERTLLRKEKNRVLVTGIRQEKLQDNLFSIPSNYEFVKN